MTDPSGHLDLDELADVLAGERDDAHLRRCRPCADRLAELAAADASVTAALAGLPPPPMPAGLPARLSRALQDERRSEPATVRPLPRRPPGWLPAVAASAVLVMAGAAGWSLLSRAGTDSADVATQAGGGGGQESDAAPEAATGLSAPAVVTDWADAASRSTALSRLLAQRTAATDQSAAVPAGDGLDRLRAPGALDACLSALPGGSDDVLAVDYAQYAGAPAAAVVRPADAGSVTVTVVGSGCSATDAEVLAEVRLPRP